jgi:hypothetical protein
MQNASVEMTTPHPFPSSLATRILEERALSNREDRALCAEMKHELQRREDVTIEQWEDDEELFRLARIIGNAMTKSMGWPDNRLVPEDELRYVFSQGLNDMMASVAIQKLYPKWHAIDIVPFWKGRLFQDLVTHVKELLKELDRKST